MSSIAEPRLVSIAPLALSEALPALALVRLDMIDLGLRDWRHFVKGWQTGGRERGIFSATNARGVVIGLAPWWIQPCLRGRAMWAGPSWVCEMGAGTRVFDALEKALAGEAGRRGCARLVIVDKGALTEIEIATGGA